MINFIILLLSFYYYHFFLLLIQYKIILKPQKIINTYFFLNVFL